MYSIPQWRRIRRGEPLFNDIESSLDDQPDISILLKGRIVNAEMYSFLVMVLSFLACAV